MIFGIGVDLIDMERVKETMSRWGIQFLKRVFTDREIEWCQKRAFPYECFAVRFAAKEAFLKAVGVGLRKGIQWKDIEIESDPYGKPFFNFYRKARDVVEKAQIHRVFLTISHDKPYAVAQVVIEGKNDESCNSRTDARIR